MKKKRIWNVILLCVLGALVLAVLLQTGWSGKYTGSDGKYLPITASDSWAHIYNHPVWQETGKEMFSIWGNSSATNLTSFMGCWRPQTEGIFRYTPYIPRRNQTLIPHCGTHGLRFIGVSPESRLQSWRQAAAISKSYPW